MTSALLNFALAAAILGGAWVLTNLFARAMYLDCPVCQTLNARRRSHCRKCGQPLRAQGREVRKPQ
jgi:hypothetical protein